MWPFAGFVNPALAWGALLAAVPLVIHLLNRQRHRPLPWAAMRFVLEAYRRTKRRAQLENLLLLLLRMAAVALLAFAVARPFTGAHSALAPLTESRRDLVLVLDDSASTGYRESVQSVHERIVERARELLSELDGARGDRVRLVRAAGTASVLGGRSPEEALALLATLTRPADEPLDLAAAMSSVVDLAEDEAAGTGKSLLEVRLLTDMQRRSFLPAPVPTAKAPDAAKGAPAGAPAGAAGAAGAAAPADDAQGTDPLQRALQHLKDLGVRVVVEDHGVPQPVPPNIGITAIEPMTEGIAVDQTLDVGVSVQNHGTEGKVVRVALEVDGQRLPSQQVELPSRGSAQAVFPVTFDAPGDHTLVAVFDGDFLDADNSRALVLHVPEPLNVLLVDGDPRQAIDEDEVGVLRAVLEPLEGDGPMKAATPFVTTTRTLAALGDGEAIDSANVIVLANVDILGPALVDRLEARVAAGAALVITAGDRMTRPAALDAWNERMWRPDGSGLLPGRLRGVVEVPDRRQSFFRIASFQQDHPALSFFSDERWRPYLTEVPIYAFLSCDVDDPKETSSGTTVLARLDDPDKSPILLARDYDRGKVVLWASSIDDAWNRLSESPSSFIPLVHELLRWAGAGPPRVRNVAVGETLSAEVGSFPREPVIVRPDGARRPLDGEPTAVTADVWRLPPTPRADEAGLWRIEGSDFDPIPFAVTLDPDEGDLTRLAPDELSGISPVLVPWNPDSSGRGDDDARNRDRGELWRWMAGLALTALVLETLWSAWIGRGRRLA